MHSPSHGVPKTKAKISFDVCHQFFDSLFCSLKFCSFVFAFAGVNGFLRLKRIKLKFFFALYLSVIYFCGICKLPFPSVISHVIHLDLQYYPT